MTNAPYKKIHVVINPASGKDEPILNTINDVFHEYGVDWDVSVTKKYGDATEQAKAAITAGADLVTGYGGDGTQHEIANAVLGTDTVMGILPGGTGNDSTEGGRWRPGRFERPKPRPASAMPATAGGTHCRSISRRPRRWYSSTTGSFSSFMVFSGLLVYRGRPPDSDTRC